MKEEIKVIILVLVCTTAICIVLVMNEHWVSAIIIFILVIGSLEVKMSEGDEDSEI